MKAMFNCHEVSRIVSDSLDQKEMTLWTQMRLWMHLGMCGVCSRFRKNMIRVDQEVRLHAAELETDRGADANQLSETARRRIKRVLSPSED